MLSYRFFASTQADPQSVLDIRVTPCENVHTTALLRLTGGVELIARKLRVITMCHRFSRHTGTKKTYGKEQS